MIISNLKEVGALVMVNQRKPWWITRGSLKYANGMYTANLRGDDFADELMLHIEASQVVGFLVEEDI